MDIVWKDGIKQGWQEAFDQKIRFACTDRNLIIFVVSLNMEMLLL
jgi:hypothetical protein